ncbi:MAG: hypothetical protein V4655_06885 [Bdellovibrionota bacterium]|nr:MAG: hypothetical protein EOP10_13865 [Pseudomonadota bacterium]
MADSKTMTLSREARLYVSNIKNFERIDWVLYATWMATIFSLFVGLFAFFTLGLVNGVQYPGYVWFVPGGTLLFVVSLAFDDIGHRTLYKEELKKGEGHVHKMIVITAVTSVMALCLCYEHSTTFKVPAIALIALSLFYSMIDEALHWYRYLTYGLDRIEMWSHFTAILGHVLMISCWWHWFSEGYPGVAETLKFLPG